MSSKAYREAEKNRLTLADRAALRRDAFYAARDAARIDATPANLLALEKAKASFFSGMSQEDRDARNAGFLARICAQPAAARVALVREIAADECIEPSNVWKHISDAIVSTSAPATAARAMMVADLAALADLAKSLGDAKGAVAAHQLSARLQGLEAPTNVQVTAAPEPAVELPPFILAAMSEPNPIAGAIMCEREDWSDAEKDEIRRMSDACLAEIRDRRVPRIVSTITAREVAPQNHLTS